MRMDDSVALLEPPPGELARLMPHRTFGFRLWMLRHAWTRRVEAALASTALTHMQFFVLCGVEHLTALGETPSQTRLAEDMQVDCMTVSKVVRTLEAKGLLTRAVHPADPRAKRLALTAPGVDAVRRGTRLVHAEQDRFFGRLGADGKAAFSDMLDTLLAQDAYGSARSQKEPH